MPRAPHMNNGTFWNRASATPSQNLNPSRKRSRDESDLTNDEATTNLTSNLAPKPVPTPVLDENPIYGEGMVLLNPRAGLAVSAESQTGTWYEEKAEEVATPVSSAPVATMQQKSDPLSLPGRKSQRLDMSAPGLDDIALSSIGKKLQTSGHDDDNHRKNKLSHSSTPEEPLVDDFTHILGISWQRVGDGDADMAAAIRGWAKYIDNHYSTYIRDSKILLKNRGLNAYLVAGQSNSNTTASTDINMGGQEQAQAVFYLFNENLCEGQLVARDWETCLQNLRSVPIVFENSNVVRASEWTPERVVEDKGVLVQSVNGDDSAGMLGGDAGHGAQDAGMGMDIDS